MAPNTLKWIVFDGPIHSDWAENLNTVLDDNRKLCLSSGEMLDLTDNTSFIFEVHDLSHASPSTVSDFVTSERELNKFYIFFRFHALKLFISRQIHWIGNQWLRPG